MRMILSPVRLVAPCRKVLQALDFQCRQPPPITGIRDLMVTVTVTVPVLRDWIPGAINFHPSESRRLTSTQSRSSTASLGLNIQISTQGEEAGAYQLMQLLASNKLKVFASLSGFLAEYRIVMTGIETHAERSEDQHQAGTEREL